jgi:hypothetical protein
MAAKMFAEVVIAGSYKNLSKSTRGATKELNIFEKNAKKISGAISAAFAGIALAGITTLADALIDMAKAAATDRQSMALLNKTLEQNWKATDQTIAGVDKYITSISYLTGIVDDDLRPAFAKIARVTKDQTKAQKAFDQVLDISAGTGKDINIVAQAYSKYLGGNKTALDKLIPGLKDAGNRLGFIDEKYKGLAAVAGANDPFAKINVALGEFQEKIGAALLPLVDKLSAWLTSPEATAQMNKFADSVADMFSYFQSTAGQDAMQGFLDDVLAIADAINNLVAEWKKLEPVLNFLGQASDIANRVLNPFASLMPSLSGLGINPMTPTVSSASPVTQYITINGVVSGNDVVKALKNAATAKGRTVLGLITN